ncbi:MAG: hypothetical protein AAF355_09535 [Myxococcota bacterium]
MGIRLPRTVPGQVWGDIVPVQVGERGGQVGRWAGGRWDSGARFRKPSSCLRDTVHPISVDKLKITWRAVNSFN